jgi:hypothetical protein
MELEETWSLIGLAGGEGMLACLHALENEDGLPSGKARWLLAGCIQRDPEILTRYDPDAELLPQLRQFAARE